MVEGIRCPKCKSDKVAEALYGLPALDKELKDRINRGDVVLEGCLIPEDGKVYPYVCRDCGHRFDERMAAKPTAKAYFSEEDYRWIEGLASHRIVDEDDEGFGDEDTIQACAELAETLLANDPESFEDLLESDPATSYRYVSQTFSRLVLMGLEYGVACGEGSCANWLGAMYYMGEVVEQDYHRAKELYELAESKGFFRAMLNLGYIYEYDRCGEPDHLRAFMQYAKVAAMTGHTEALYKMGDMYSRGKVVERDVKAAHYLYERSLAAAEGVVEQAQPAVRIANLISVKHNEGMGIPFDPMRALELYQLAERGLRIDIARGQTYYARRLQEAIDGQERMREVLEEPFVIL